MPKQREAAVEVTDPLSEFGNQRGAAVRAVNQCVARSANAGEFTDRYREQQPHHADKPAARLLMLATASQKAVWLRTARVQEWWRIREQ